MVRREKSLKASWALPFNRPHWCQSSSPTLTRQPGWIGSQDRFVYRIGRFKVAISRPRLAFETTTVNAHYSRVFRFPGTGTLAMMINTALEAVGPEGGWIILSHDNGQTWGGGYSRSGQPTTAEPLQWDSTSNAFIGGRFEPPSFDLANGGANKRAFTCPKWSLGNDGTTYTQIGTCSFSGMPTDIAENDYIAGHPDISWFGHILPLADDNWLTTLPITTVASLPRCQSFCFKSTDKGTTWTYLSSLPEGSEEGCDEGTLIKLADGRLMFSSRIGQTNIRIAFSSDNGATWSALIAPSPWGPGVFTYALTGTPDYVLMTGAATAASLWPAGNDPFTWRVPAGYATSMQGLFITSTPDVLGWPVVDFVIFHNATVNDGNKCMGTAFPRGIEGGGGPSNYMSCVELEPNHLIVSYDRDNENDFSAGNQVFVVDVWIERTS